MTIHTVGPTSSFPTIAAAMLAAAPADTILLQSGYSNETATVTHGGMTISGDTTSTGIVLQLGTGIATIFLGGTAPINIQDAADGNGITGNDGDNVITVTSGVDAVNGLLGTDRLVVDYQLATGAVTGNSTSNYTEAGGGGRSVTITDGTFEHFTVLTGAGADTLTVGDGNNVVGAGDGANTITAGNGQNIIAGGIGADTITAGNGGNTIDAGSGTNNITTGSGADTIYTSTGADTIIAGGGDDLITVRGGSDTVSGGAQTDRLVVDYSALTTAVSGGVTGGNFQTGYTVHVADTTTNQVDATGIENFSIATGSGNDAITTGDGDDLISTGAGTDSLTGGDGSDHLFGGSGGDTLDGGLGTDYANYSTAATNVLANLVDASGNVGDAAGDSYLSIEGLVGSNFSDVLRIGDGGASIFALAGDDYLLGGAGNDQLYGGVGADVHDGGAGTDFANYGGAATNVLANLQDASGNVGDAAGDSYISIEGLIGSQFNDVLKIGNGGGSIWAQEGDDFLLGGAGNDDLNGQDGNDHLYGGAGADVLDGGAGTDFANYSTAATNVLANLVDASGNVGDAAGDSYVSIEGLVGSQFSDVLRIGDGGASIYGLAGDDNLLGGAGNDHLYGGTGADVLDGGAGTDYANYATAAASVRANLLDASGNTGDAAGDSYISIEGLVGSNFSDVLQVGNAGGSIYAQAGDDVLGGGTGNDDLHGEDGNDHLYGGVGADVLDGGAGTDFANYSTAATNVLANLVDASGNVGDAAGDSYVSIEGLVGSQFSDVLRIGDGGASIYALAGDDYLLGGTGSDHLYGGAGADVLDGGAGTDFANYSTAATNVLANLQTPSDNVGDAAGDSYTSIEGLVGSQYNDVLKVLDSGGSIWAQAGDDYLLGGTGNDDLNGQDGNDVLMGGGGVDALSGGAGDDSFVFVSGQSNGDSIADFAGNGAGVGDSLQFTGYGTAGQGATFVQADATHWTINSADGLVHDTLTITNAASIDLSDYLFV